jgi:hypothetical protein
MAKCFVIQPFDGDKFDKRYKDIYAPAIIAAGLEPYRVDQDPGVVIPIEEIESGIRNSELCFAEITLDNPNVWYELGFSFAAKKDVVLICSEERESRFPFDVQHRSIIKYKTDAPQDFSDLKLKITERIKALLKKQEEIGKMSLPSIKSTEGLSQHEIVALVIVMQNEFMSQGRPSGTQIKEDMDKAGFTDIAVSLALKMLIRKGMLEVGEAEDEYRNSYKIYNTTRKGEEWLMQNQNSLVLKRETKVEPPF